MPPLEALTREAAALASNASPLYACEAEVDRVMQICNACRYCEGFCAVFPAMTRRLEFSKADIHYLANLCHNCGACLHACQYAAPHPFAVNVPKALATVRVKTYTDYAWPARLGALYQKNGLTLSLATAGSLTVFLVLAILRDGPLIHAPLAGNFYAVFPHHVMAAIFGVVFGFTIVALSLGVNRFWGDVSPGAATATAVNEAAHHALLLTYLDGGHGEGCNESDDAFTLWRRRFHHLTFYGFMLCFASTSVATLYHYAFNLHAPYPLASLPVMLGIAGGIGLLAGPAGLFWLNVQRHPDHGDNSQQPMDRGFIALLFLISLTGLALMIWRDSGAMALLLAIHLAVVMALFATMPYSKFAHGVFRGAALLKYTIEKRQPDKLKLGSE